MASITKRPNGNKWIQFSDKNKKRQTIRLGKCSKRDADAVLYRIENLIGAQFRNSQVDRETIVWTQSLSDVIFDRIAAVGLIEPRQSTELSVFVDAYILSRTDLKPATIEKYRNTERRLLEFYGDQIRLDKITCGDAEDFARWMATKVKSENTVRKAVQQAKTIFGYACRKELIHKNPCFVLASNTVPKKDREFFVSREHYDKVIEECPSSEWRLLFSFARIGGMRIPSEPRELKWTDIDWSNQRITVTAPKTEHPDPTPSNRRW
jgi:integrase